MRDTGSVNQNTAKYSINAVAAVFSICGGRSELSIHFRCAAPVFLPFAPDAGAGLTGNGNLASVEQKQTVFFKTAHISQIDDRGNAALYELLVREQGGYLGFEGIADRRRLDHAAVRKRVENGTGFSSAEMSSSNDTKRTDEPI